jgi:hypothetical protein
VSGYTALREGLTCPRCKRAEVREVMATVVGPKRPQKQVTRRCGSCGWGSLPETQQSREWRLRGEENAVAKAEGDQRSAERTEQQVRGRFDLQD